MCAYLYYPQNQNHAYLVVSKSTSSLGFQTLPSNLTYIFSIDKQSGFVYSSSIQNVDVFNSLNEAKNFLSINCKDENINLTKLGDFLIGSSITDSASLLISVIEDSKSYTEIASIFDHKIYQINTVKSIFLHFQPKNEPFTLKTTDLSKYNFYFSPSLDLSSPFPYFYINKLNLKNNIFCFNRSFLSDFVENQLLIACVIVIKGFIDTKDNLIYLTKFCNNSNITGNVNLDSNSQKFECECELIFKKTVFSANKKGSQINYYSHAWRRGPNLCLNNKNKDKISETKRYISKEILTRFNIGKVHFFSFHYTNDEFLKTENDLKDYFKIEELVIKDVSEEQNIIQTQKDQTISKISDKLQIPNDNHKYSFFTIINENYEVICIQDFIFRFMSSDCLQMTDMITCAFLSKLTRLVLDTDYSTSKVEFLINSATEAGKCLNDFTISKGSQWGIFALAKIVSKKDASSDYFTAYSNLNRNKNKRFLLDPQHMSCNINKSSNKICLSYVFPEPFILCDLSFLVYPQKDQQDNQDKNCLIAYVQPSQNSNSIIQLTIPKVNKKTWLKYDFRYIMKKSLQYPFDPDYYTPTSSLFITFRVSDEQKDSFTIKDINISVKKKINHPFKFIVPTLQSFFNLSDFGVNFDDKQRNFLDLIKINNYRIEKHFNCLTKNNLLSSYYYNPWLYDLKSQLLSKEKYDCCPFCAGNFKSGFSFVEIINDFDPILFTTSDNNVKDNYIKICKNCATTAKSMISYYQEKKDNFIFVDNSNSISYSMKKWQRPNNLSNGPINLSHFCQFFNQDNNLNECLFNNSNSIVYINQPYNLHFFTLVNINSIRIELNNFSKLQDDFKINIKFDRSETQNVDLPRQNSSFVFEKEFSDSKNINLITITFSTKNKKSLINIKKIDIIGTLSKLPFVHPRFENIHINDKNVTEIKPTFQKNYKKLLFDSKTRIQLFEVSFSSLYGIFLKSPDSNNHSRSLIVIVNELTPFSQNPKVFPTNFILPQLPKDEIFYYSFDIPRVNVNRVYILYLDCVPKIEPFAVSFNGTISRKS